MISPDNESVLLIWIRAIQPFFPTVAILNGGEFGDENRPKPDKPYLILNIINGPTFDGEDEFRESETVGDFTVQNIVRYTLSTQGIGTMGDTILSYMASTLFSPYYKSDGTANLAQVLKEQGIAIHSRGEIINIEENLNTGFERRKTMEVDFSLVYEVSTDEDGRTIDSTVYSGEVDDRIIPETKVEP